MRATTEHARAQSYVLLVALASACTGLYLWMGAGWVLDDFLLLRYAHFGGALNTLPEPRDRPAVGPYWILTFGIVGSPVFVAICGGALIALSACLWYRIVRRFAPDRLALLAAALWVLLPVRTSIEMWLVTTGVAWALAFALLAIDVALAETISTRRLVVVVVCGLVSLLSYEATAVLLAPALVLLPWRLHGHPDRKLVVAAVAMVAATGAYILLNGTSNRGEHGWADVSLVWPANFGWGIGTGAVESLASLAGLAIVTTLVVRIARPRLRSEGAEVEMVAAAGLAIMALGTVPYLRYFYEPLGAGDRVNFISSLGASCVWAAGLMMVWRKASVIGAAALVALCVLAGMTRWNRTRIWSTAARDASRIVAGIKAKMPTPPSVIYLGPTPVVRDNIAAFADDSNLFGALQIAYDRRDVEAHVLHDPAAFDAAPEAARFDACAVSELETVKLIELGLGAEP